MSRRLVSAVPPIVLVGILVILPALGLSNFWISFGVQLFIWITLATSWNLFSGYAGYPSFGHGVFYGLGVYTVATLLTKTSLPFLLVVLAAGLLAGLVALVVGMIIFLSAQFRGDIFGLATLALAFVAATIISNVSYIDGGTGVFVTVSIDSWVLQAGTTGLYVLALGLATSTNLIAWLIDRGRWGRALRAIRDDEGVAEGLGVATYWYKVWTFALSAGLAGLAGAPQAIFLGYLEVRTVFALAVTLFVLMMAILGGMTAWYGPLIGATAVTALQQYLIGQGQAEMNQILLGAFMIGVILLAPQGIAGELQRRLGARRSDEPVGL